MADIFGTSSTPSAPSTRGEEDLYGAERGVTPPEPEVAAEDGQVRAMRSLAAVGLVFGTAAAASLPFGLLRLHQG